MDGHGRYARGHLSISRWVGTASKKVEGTEHGLTISRKFIELHGRTIWVKSAAGSDSTFAFTLPLR